MLGYPVNSLAGIKAGDYWVQGLLHVYETFHRGDGKTVKLPAGDRGEGQQWPDAPGNLYSKPVKMHIDPTSTTPIHIVLDQTIPQIPQPPDTKYVKHFKVKSERLTKFWGRPVYLGAILVLPEGFDTHPDAHYPLAISHGHFESDIGDFRESPPDAKLPAVQSRQLDRALPERSRDVAVHEVRLRAIAAGEGVRILQGVDWPGLPARAAADHPAPHAVLRRFVRGELREQRPVRRRDHLRADSVRRVALSRARGVGARRVRRLHWRLGGARRAGQVSRRTTTAHG